jgi:hypothetical protein
MSPPSALPTPPTPPNATLSAADLRYIRASYVPLATLCSGRCSLADARSEIRARRAPAASYLLDDGTEMVPGDYFALLDEAGGADALPARFRARFERAALGAGVSLDSGRVLREWEAYLDGAYGVCLREVTPEAIFEKESLVLALELLLARPLPEDVAWRTRLREHVTRLDALVREFAPCDRARFGGTVSRDRLITDVRRRFPRAFSP